MTTTTGSRVMPRHAEPGALATGRVSSAEVRLARDVDPGVRSTRRLAALRPRLVWKYALPCPLVSSSPPAPLPSPTISIREEARERRAGPQDAPHRNRRKPDARRHHHRRHGTAHL